MSRVVSQRHSSSPPSTSSSASNTAASRDGLREAVRGMGYQAGAQALSPFVQRKASGAASHGDPARAALAGFEGPGGALPHSAAMERSFGEDLSGVRAHTGPAARHACENLGARAYAYDGQVAFADASPDKGLVAHEVTHVLQERKAGGAPQAKGGLGSPSGGAERQADRVQSAVESGGQASDVLAGEPLAQPEGVQRFKAKDLGIQFSANTEGAATRAHFPIIPTRETPRIPIPLAPTPLVMMLYGTIGLQGSYQASANDEGEVAHKVGIWGPMRMFLSGGAPHLAEIYGSLDFTASGSGSLTMGPEGSELSLVRVDMSGGVSLGAKLGPAGAVEVRIPVAGANLFWMTFGTITSDGTVDGFEWDWGDDVYAAIDRLKELYEWAVNLPARAWETAGDVVNLVMDPMAPLENALEGINSMVDFVGSGVAALEEFGEVMGGLGECFGSALFQGVAYDLGYLHAALYQAKPRVRGRRGENSTIHGIHRDLIRPFEAEYRQLLSEGRRAGGSYPPINHFAALKDKTLADLSGEHISSAEYVYAAYTDAPVPDLGSMTAIGYLEWMRGQNWLAIGRRDPAEAGMSLQAQADSGLREEREQGCMMGTLPEEEGQHSEVSE